MRLSNRRKIPLYNFTQTFLIIMLIGGICTFLLEKLEHKQMGSEEYLLLVVPLFFLFLLFLRGRSVFDFDSDGEALTIKNFHSLPFIFQPRSDEFPKYKLMNFNVVNVFIIKRLYISLNSRNNARAILKYDISNLTKKEIKDLEHSLSKVISNNKKNAPYKSQQIE